MAYRIIEVREDGARWLRTTVYTHREDAERNARLAAIGNTNPAVLEFQVVDGDGLSLFHTQAGYVKPEGC